MLRLRSGKESSDFWSRARSVLFECENQASGAGAFRWYRHYSLQLSMGFALPFLSFLPRELRREATAKTKTEIDGNGKIDGT